MLTSGPVRIGRWQRLRLWFEMLVLDFGWIRCLYNRPRQIAPGVYRSSQPWPHQLRALARQGLRTVINLRAMPEHQGSFVLEQETCAAHGIRLLQFRMRSRDVPHPQEVHAFAALLGEIEYPVLLHCKSGADRAGLASALVLLLREHAAPAVAARQLSLRYGHVRQAKTGILDYFLQRYIDDQARRPREFLRWIDEDFDPVRMRREFRAQWWASLLTDRLLRRE